MEENSKLDKLLAMCERLADRPVTVNVHVSLADIDRARKRKSESPVEVIDLSQPIPYVS